VYLSGWSQIFISMLNARLKACATLKHESPGSLSYTAGMAGSARRAVVIGAGPNGLAAAIVLAQAGLQVEVFEAEPQAGGGARTLPLTLPGFMHDFGSAVHPMALASPFFSTLPLREYGLEWVQPSAPLAHPLDDGTAVILEQDLRDAQTVLGEDGKKTASSGGGCSDLLPSAGTSWRRKC
jgi:phytoene dehydrogenase-like protein